MSKEQGPGESQRPWRPNAAFFLSDPRSAELREVCIGIVECTTSLSEDPAIASDIPSQQQLYAELEHLGGRLIGMGIEDDMNTGLPEEAYRADPVITAEWIAGQLLSCTGSHIPSETEIIPIVQEFAIEMIPPIQELTEVKAENVHAIDLEGIPPKMQRFMEEKALLSFIQSLLDIPPKDRD